MFYRTLWFAFETFTTVGFGKCRCQKYIHRSPSSHPLAPPSAGDYVPTTAGRNYWIPALQFTTVFIGLVILGTFAEAAQELLAALHTLEEEEVQ